MSHSQPKTKYCFWEGVDTMDSSLSPGKAFAKLHEILPEEEALETLGTYSEEELEYWMRGHHRSSILGSIESSRLVLRVLLQTILVRKIAYAFRFLFLIGHSLFVFDIIDLSFSP